jgi:hypothetical protein
MLCIIELDGKHCIERDSFKEVKKEVNASLKKKKKVLVNGKQIKDSFTKETWTALEKGLLSK